MTILIAIISVYAFTGLTYLVRRNFSVNVCSICVGVSLTWVWMLSGISLGALSSSYFFPTMVLMSLSVLGIANKLNQKQYKFWQSPKTPIRNSDQNSRAEELEEKMKGCC